MALVKSTNSYVNVSEANAYFADRLDAAAWTSAPAPQKEQSLVTATSILDNLNWSGCVVSEAQALAFPREGEYFDPRIGYSIVLPTDAVPDRIIKATFELAHHLLNNDGLLDDTGSVESLVVGEINLQKIRAPGSIPGNVNRLIRPLLQAGGSHMWWRAN